jgi:hypothetical protein
MGYVGNPLPANFQASPAVVRFNGDGSDTTFALGRTISNVQDILVSVDGVVQDSSAYTILELAGGNITPAAENKGNFKGGGLFRTNAQSLGANITILATENANVTGPLTITSGVTLTVESGGRLVTI